MTSNLKKYGALAGISFPIVQMIAQSLIQVGGAEPKFSATTSEILAFFQNRNVQLFEIGSYLSSISALLFVWFVAFLWNELRSLEGESGWISMIALGSGLVTAAAFNVGGWALAIFRINEELGPQMARLLFDEGNFNFANMWVSSGSMVLAAGLIFRASSNYPRWFGTGSILLALGLFAARAFLDSSDCVSPLCLLLAVDDLSRRGFSPTFKIHEVDIWLLPISNTICDLGRLHC